MLLQYWTMQVFGSDAACAGYLGTLISVLFGQSISMLTSIQVHCSDSELISFRIHWLDIFLADGGDFGFRISSDECINCFSHV